VPVVLLGSLLVVAAFVVFRIVVRRDYRSKGRLSWVSSLLETAIFALWAWYAYANSPATWPALHVSTFTAIVGWTLFAGGMTLTLAAMTWLGLRRTFGHDIGTLQSSGVYRVTRNPQAVAFTIGMLGYLILWPSWRGVIALALLAAILHIMILTEEEHLGATYGDEYTSYTRLVPRYIGARRHRG